MLRYPELLTVPEARKLYNVALLRLTLQAAMILGFLLAIVSIVLRRRKVLGLSAIVLILLATMLGGPSAQSRGDVPTELYFGLDWFLLNLIFTGVLFIPLEASVRASRGSAHLSLRVARRSILFPDQQPDGAVPHLSICHSSRR